MFDPFLVGATVWIWITECCKCIRLSFHSIWATAEALGLKDLVPAYLDPALQPAELLTGVSFASGASGYDPLTAELSVQGSSFRDDMY